MERRTERGKPLVPPDLPLIQQHECTLPLVNPTSSYVDRQEESSENYDRKWPVTTFKTYSPAGVMKGN